MTCFILCESLPHPLESCEWDEDDVCSCVVNMFASDLRIWIVG